jgi:hypothetical protein
VAQTRNEKAMTKAALRTPVIPPPVNDRLRQQYARIILGLKGSNLLLFVVKHRG